MDWDAGIKTVPHHAQYTVIDPSALRTQCLACGLHAPESALEPLTVYLGMLMRWNVVMNLVGTRTWQDTLRNLVADSFYVADVLTNAVLPPEPLTLDLGAGAGLPGLPLRMLWQKGSYTLIEAREKRALFMQNALSQLALPRTHVFHGRVETYFATHTPADCILSRAFMPWPQLLAFVRPHLHAQGHVLCMTRTPPPPLPSHWHIVTSKEYRVHNDLRWLWLLQAPPLIA